MEDEPMEDLEANNDENNPDVTDNRQARFPIPRPGSMSTFFLYILFTLPCTFDLACPV